MTVLLIASPGGPFGRWPLVGHCDRHRLGIGYGGYCHCASQFNYLSFLLNLAPGVYDFATNGP